MRSSPISVNVENCPVVSSGICTSTNRRFPPSSAFFSMTARAMEAEPEKKSSTVHSLEEAMSRMRLMRRRG